MSIVIWVDTIINLMSLLLYFANKNFINFILWKWLLESDSRNIRTRKKKFLRLVFSFTLKKCIVSGYYCLYSNCILTLMYSTYCFTLALRSAQNYFLQPFITLFNVVGEKIFIGNLPFLTDSELFVDTPLNQRVYAFCWTKMWILVKTRRNQKVKVPHKFRSVEPCASAHIRIGN